MAPAVLGAGEEHAVAAFGAEDEAALDQRGHDEHRTGTAGDPGIGAPEVPAQATMTRPFVAEITILQRERNPDTPMVLWTIGGLVVLVCTLILIGGLSGGAGRINRTDTSGSKAELQPTAQA